ncbi:hypothetical protein MHYP_G00341660 [Metynnis hypsauchen]
MKVELSVAVVRMLPADVDAFASQDRFSSSLPSSAEMLKEDRPASLMRQPLARRKSHLPTHSGLTFPVALK